MLDLDSRKSVACVCVVGMLYTGCSQMLLTDFCMEGKGEQEWKQEETAESNTFFSRLHRCCLERNMNEIQRLCCQVRMMAPMDREHMMKQMEERFPGIYPEWILKGEKNVPQDTLQEVERAIQGGDMDTLEELLGAQGEVVHTFLPNMRTPLIHAIWGGTEGVEVVEVLLRHGAEVNRIGIAGMTSLMCAVFCEREDLVQLLLQKGADLCMENMFGKTVIQCMPDPESHPEFAAIYAILREQVSHQSAWNGVKNAVLSYMSNQGDFISIYREIDQIDSVHSREYVRDQLRKHFPKIPPTEPVDKVRCRGIITRGICSGEGADLDRVQAEIVGLSGVNRAYVEKQFQWLLRVMPGFSSSEQPLLPSSGSDTVRTGAVDRALCRCLAKAVMCTKSSADQDDLHAQIAEMRDVEREYVEYLIRQEGKAVRLHEIPQNSKYYGEPRGSRYCRQGRFYSDRKKGDQNIRKKVLGGEISLPVIPFRTEEAWPMLRKGESICEGELIHLKQNREKRIMQRRRRNFMREESKKACKRVEHEKRCMLDRLYQLYLQEPDTYTPDFMEECRGIMFADEGKRSSSRDTVVESPLPEYLGDIIPKLGLDQGESVSESAIERLAKHICTLGREELDELCTDIDGSEEICDEVKSRIGEALRRESPDLMIEYEWTS